MAIDSVGGRMTDSNQALYQKGELVTVNVCGERILEAEIVMMVDPFPGYESYLIKATKIFEDHIHLATKHWEIGTIHEVGVFFLTRVHPLIELARAAK